MPANAAPHVSSVLSDEVGIADAIIADCIDQLELIEAMIAHPEEEFLYLSATARMLERMRRKLATVREIVRAGGSR